MAHVTPGDTCVAPPCMSAVGGKRIRRKSRRLTGMNLAPLSHRVDSRPVIRLDGVTKTYPKASRPSLEDVSVSIDKGDFVFFIGPSGSGKSKGVARRVVPEVLELVGLGGKEHRYPHELSGGEQQRVAVARAFVNRPLILLADEPTGNLDPDTSIEIMRLLDRINRTGTTVVMVTHDSNIVNQMRRRVVEIESGKIVRDQPRGVYG